MMRITSHHWTFCLKDWKCGPRSIAVNHYAIYKQAAGKTAKSILISVGVRLAAFNLKQIANLTCTDELDLYSIGEKK